jgi:small subunit ribosomal protein S16
MFLALHKTAKVNMLTIRLSRIGKKNKPMYRLIISEKSRDLYGQSLEILGSYNPGSKELQTKAERIRYWLEKGAGMSATVNNLLVEKGIIKGEKVKASKIGSKKKEEKKQTGGEPGDQKPKTEEIKAEKEKTPEKIGDKSEKIEEKQTKIEIKPEEKETKKEEELKKTEKEMKENEEEKKPEMQPAAKENVRAEVKEEKSVEEEKAAS